jgi:hypothetical protein
MSDINILHISDAHFGQKGMAADWPSLRERLFEDLRYLIGRTGALDLIVFTGDIANRASQQEYVLASEFLQDLGELALTEADVVPVFASVPGNHDVQRAQPGKYLRKALWSDWNRETDTEFFSDPQDELRGYAQSLFENYKEWSTSPLPISHIPFDSAGVLPGDYTAHLNVRGVRLGLVGLNSAFRHVSDEAAPGTLTVSAGQVQASSGGDLQKWANGVDLAIALTHHPISWLRDPEDTVDSLFGGQSKVGLHLCGHLHEEKYTAAGLGAADSRLTHQAHAIFGLEGYGPSAAGQREHGYALLSVAAPKNNDPFSLRVWPRRAVRTSSGTWSVDSDKQFGLPKGSESSKPVELRAHLAPAGALETDQRPVDARATRELPSDDESKRNISEFLRTLETGNMSLVLGDRRASDSGSTSSVFESFRASVWDALGSSFEPDKNFPNDELTELIGRIDSTALANLVSDHLGNPTGEMIREARTITAAPWTEMIYLSPLRDVDQVDIFIGDAEDQAKGLIADTTSSVFRLPADHSQALLLRMCSPASADGSGSLSFSVASGGRSNDGHVSDWIRHADVITTRSPTLFLTDSVDSLGFWRWIAERRTANGKYRLPAFLVCPELAPHQMRALESYAIRWIAMPVKAFVEKYLIPQRQEVAKGIQARQSRRSGAGQLASVDLSPAVRDSGSGSKEYLLGRQPRWGDLVDGFATKLSSYESVRESLTQGDSGVVRVVTGTAGCGRSTVLMQTALQFLQEGKRVAWVSSFASEQIPRIVEAVRAGGFDIVYVDDIDVFGSRAGSFVDDLRAAAGADAMIAVGARSVRLELLDFVAKRKLIYVDQLEKDDFEKLVVLLQNHRVVANRQLSDRQVIELLKDHAQGQLLVGMIQATSGLSFAEKIRGECSQIPAENLAIYAAAAIVTAEHEEISRDHLMQLDRRSAQKAWATLRGLENGRMLIPGNGEDTVMVRHRVVASAVVSYLKEAKILASTFGAVLHSFAAAGAHIVEHSDPTRRTLIRLMNHSYIISLNLSAPEVRVIYDSVEEILEGDFHYWLQRGSYEAEHGEIDFAMHHLRAALSTAGGERDYKVLTELALLRLRIAREDVTSEATVQALEALVDLLQVLREHGTATPHSMVILAQHGVPWLHDAEVGRAAKREIVEDSLRLLAVGLRLVDTNAAIAATVPKALNTLREMQRELG